MATAQLSLPSLDYEILEKEYPGVTRIQQKFTSPYHAKLIKLCSLIQYNVPKHFYPFEMQQFAHFLQEACLDFLQSQTDFDDDLILPAQINRTISPISDEEEAQVLKKIQQQITLQATKFNITDFQRYIQNFQIPETLKFVNPKIIDTIKQFEAAKIEKSVFQNFNLKVNVQKKPMYNKTPSIKTPLKKDRQQKPQLVITIGDKISVEVKEMRSFIKAASMQSFAINSIQDQLKKSQFQKHKLQISLALNKVARQNIIDMFNQISPIVLPDFNLSQFLIDETLNKCVLECKMLSVYLDFVSEFTTIPNSQFGWNYNEMNGTHHKTNNIHCILTQKIENLFKISIQSIAKSKKLKAYGSIIGYLIEKKKISSKVYFIANNHLLMRMIENSKLQFAQQFENYFEAHLCLIENLKHRFEQLWAHHQLKQMLAQEVKSSINSLLPGQTIMSMQQLLVALNQISKFPTARIKCLIQNVFQRKSNTNNTIQYTKQLNHQQEQSQDNHSQVLQLLREDNGIQLALQFYQNHGRNIKTLYYIILEMFDGTQAQINKNMETFKNVQKVTKQQFHECLEKNIINLMFQQCDLPFLASGISIILINYDKEQALNWNVIIQQDNQDFADTQLFIQKITNKINYYLKSNDMQLYH